LTQSSLSDAGVGRALFTTRFRLSLQAAIMCLTFAVVAFLAPLGYWLYAVSPQDLDVVRMHAVGRMVSQDKPRLWRARRAGSEERKVLTAITAAGDRLQWLTPPQMRMLVQPLDRAVDVFTMVLWCSAGLALLVYAATWLALRAVGSDTLRNKRIRGASLVVSSDELNERVLKKGGGGYRFADVLLPRSAPMKGIMACGSPGSGKSLAIHDLMQQVFARKKKVIIYDQSSEFFRAYFRPGKDFFFNPAFVGSVPWSIFSELRRTYDADTLAQAFLPPKSGEAVSGPGAFFEDAARALFSVILLRLAQRGAVNTSDIARVILDMPEDEMDRLIESSVASSAVGGDSKQQRQGVISSIAIYLSGIAAVQPGDWTIRSFLERDDDSRLFILGTSDTRAMCAPLFRLLLTVSFGAIAAKQEIVNEDRYWYFLDEVAQLGDIKLDEQMATLRKNGVCVVTGIQSVSQYVVAMGKERAATVSNCFSTVLQLRVADSDMQRKATDRLGVVEMDTVGRNQALAVTESRDGAALNKTEHEKPLVISSDIGEAPDCVGWLKVESHPAAKVNYESWIKKRWPWSAPHADRFKPVQPLPERDPRFDIIRAETDDAIEALKREVAAKAKPAVDSSDPSNLDKPASEGDAPGKSKPEDDLDTGPTLTLL
jgi:type IV secretory pathway TraG/TraD family ATPase VirD4